MSWNKQLSQLRDALAVLVPFKEDTLPCLTDAGIQWMNIQLSTNPSTLWHNILSYADSTSQVNILVDTLLNRFPDNPHLLAYKEKIKYSLGPEIKNNNWKSSADSKTLEKITGSKSTLLPISFLSTGLQKAKSVARILIQKASGTEAGTGFLLPNNLLLTNNHVIGDKSTALQAKVQFGYELGDNKLPLQHTEFDLDPNNGFATSQIHDWTVVRVKNNANSSFGQIELKSVNIMKNDFVNIIQHPGGRYKQIAMYHNLVTYSNNEIVQYLTDTEPGSSGSPVFNNDWEVVALHHSGGILQEPGTEQKLLRNEGININRVIDGIKNANL
jgi:V8-like Glu-specific endopeptidase